MELDPDTGVVSVLRTATVADVGKAINPQLVEGQIVALETVHHGIESLPAAMLELFRGGNIGKTVVLLDR